MLRVTDLAKACDAIRDLCRTGFVMEIGSQYLQEITGTYVLRAKMLSVVDGVYGISNNITKRLTDSESLAAYETIHPLYIKVIAHSVFPFRKRWTTSWSTDAMSVWTPAVVQKEEG